jgi:hypothetical protein
LLGNLNWRPRPTQGCRANDDDDDDDDDLRMLSDFQAICAGKLYHLVGGFSNRRTGLHFRNILQKNQLIFLYFAERTKKSHKFDVIHTVLLLTILFLQRMTILEKLIVA